MEAGRSPGFDKVGKDQKDPGTQKQTTTTASTQASQPKPSPLSSEGLLAAVQLCHKDVEAMQSGLAKQVEDLSASQMSMQSTINKSLEDVVAAQSSMGKQLDELATISTHLKQVKHDVTSVNGDVKLVSQRVTGIEGILGVLMPQVKNLAGSLSTLSTNVDSIRQMTDSHWKEVSKCLATMAGMLKSNHTQWEQTTEKNQQYLVDGVKEVLKKVTTCDYDSFTSLTKQLDQLGQELLASVGFLQGETSSLKEGLYNVAVALANTGEQVATVKEYCERPPVPLLSGAPPPPSYEAPSVVHHTDRRQLHLQTAIPMMPPPHHQPSQPSQPPTQSGSASVYVDLGEGRRVNIPLFR
ncbi:FCPF [Symbiodinium sp. CCMP2592]|nr:FCPF [Symbiodinium sp. CCMP2592]